MYITNNKFNTMPEQVQENADNIKKLNEALSKVDGTIKGVNIWTNEDPSQTFEARVISDEKFLKPYNIIEFIFIENISAETLAVKSIKLDLDINYPVKIQILNGTEYAERTLTYNTLTNEIEISNCKTVDFASGEADENNNLIVPLGATAYVENITY